MTFIKTFLEQLYTILVLYILMWFLCLRLNQQSIERTMDLTDSFTWEEMPTRDADTGYLTAAGWIRRITFFSTRISLGLLTFLFTQSTIRVLTSHETIYTAWYPFNWTISPFYELVIISQVTHSFSSYISLNVNL